MGKTPGAGSDAVGFAEDWLDADGERARGLVDEAKERGASLVEAWVARKNAPAVAAIAADDAAPAPARKAARRGINVLKSRGVAIPDRSHVARLPGDPIEGYDAWFVPPDGGGTLIVLIASRR